MLAGCVRSNGALSSDRRLSCGRGSRLKESSINHLIYMRPLAQYSAILYPSPDTSLCSYGARSSRQEVHTEGFAVLDLLPVKDENSISVGEDLLWDRR